MKILNFSHLFEKEADIVYKLSDSLGIELDVCGDMEGVIIEASGPSDKIDKLKEQLKEFHIKGF